MADESAQLAQRIAEAGRQEVVARLRDALAHQVQLAGTAPLTVDQLEQLAAECAGRADGVVWRRALAGVAVVELGIGLGAATMHPAVVSAHALTGAPEFTGLTAAAPAPDAPPAPAAPPTPATPPAPAAPPAAATPPAPAAGSPPPPPPARGSVAERVAAATPNPEPDPDASPPPAPHGDAAPQPAPAADPAPKPADPLVAEPQIDALRVAAIHLGGIDALRAGEHDLELRVSPAGLDVLKRSTGAAIGRLEWSEIRAVELPRPRRGLVPGRRRAQELHVTTERGQATFELPGLTEEQVGEHLEPMLARMRPAAES